MGVMSDKSAMGRKNRRRGGDFEREFCRWVREEFGIEFSRNWKQWGCAQEGDTDPLAGMLPECKNVKDRNPGELRKHWNQACVQAKKRDLVPLLVYKIPHHKFRAVIPSPTAWATGAEWRYDYEYAHDIGPAELALIVREHGG